MKNISFVPMSVLSCRTIGRVRETEKVARRYVMLSCLSILEKKMQGGRADGGPLGQDARPAQRWTAGTGREVPPSGGPPSQDIGPVRWSGPVPMVYIHMGRFSHSPEIGKWSPRFDLL